MSPIAQDKSQQTQWENEFEERDVKVFIFESESEQRRKQNEGAPRTTQWIKQGADPIIANRFTGFHLNASLTVFALLPPVFPRFSAGMQAR